MREMRFLLGTLICNDASCETVLSHLDMDNAAQSHSSSLVPFVSQNPCEGQKLPHRATLKHVELAYPNACSLLQACAVAALLHLPKRIPKTMQRMPLQLPQRRTLFSFLSICRWTLNLHFTLRKCASFLANKLFQFALS